jgi:hypothetical protein
VGTIKGAGKIDLQSVVDAHSSLGFGKLYLSKLPMTGVDMLHGRVLPFGEKHQVEAQHLLTDNGREFCRRPLAHPYELFLAISQIEHRRTDVVSPETNDFCERFPRTVKEEFFQAAFRRTLYESLDQLQHDLERYLEFYNRERAHQGHRTQGRTPCQAFLYGVDQLPDTAAQEQTLAPKEATAYAKTSHHRKTPVSGNPQLITDRPAPDCTRKSALVFAPDASRVPGLPVPASFPAYSATSSMRTSRPAGVGCAQWRAM